MRYQPLHLGSRAQEGFSLLELVIVVAVLAILAAIALPAFTDISKDAKIAAAKHSLVQIIRECIAYGVSNSVNPTVADIVSARSTNNPNGDRLGLNFTADGFTYDTDIDSQVMLVPSHSCYQVAAKSTTCYDGNKGCYPHFMIQYNQATGQTTRTCKVDGGQTYYKPKHCAPNSANGQDW